MQLLLSLVLVSISSSLTSCLSYIACYAVYDDDVEVTTCHDQIMKTGISILVGRPILLLACSLNHLAFPFPIPNSSCVRPLYTAAVPKWFAANINSALRVCHLKVSMHRHRHRHRHGFYKNPGPGLMIQVSICEGRDINVTGLDVHCIASSIF